MNPSATITVAVLSLLCAAAPAAAAEQQPDLTGKVSTADGKPLAGATAYVYTAGVKTGTSPFCPSCYADCGKTATSGADGSFRIPSLSPELRFNLLFVAEGYKPAFVNKVDPAVGPIEARLQPVSAAALDPSRVLKGRVLGPDGKPVVGASVEPFGCKTEARRWWGSMPGVDPLSITNARGEFLITSREPFLGLDVKVFARGLGPRVFNLLSPGAAGHELKLGTGATVTGRLTKDGKPLAGVNVGMVQKDRGTENFTGHLTIGTDADGRFMFSNVAPPGEWVVYGKMEDLAAQGSVAAEVVEVGPDDTTSDAGEFTVGPAHTVSGRVVLSDGKPVPPRTRLILSRDRAWDSQSVILDEQGRFTLRGVPPELVSISVRVHGYRISPKNRSVNLPNLSGFLEGLVDGDIPNLQILLEPGRPEPLDNKARQEAFDRVRENRARRIEGVPPPSISSIRE